jgi:hypothetical protein
MIEIVVEAEEIGTQPAGQVIKLGARVVSGVVGLVVGVEVVAVIGLEVHEMVTIAAPLAR